MFVWLRVQGFESSVNKVIQNNEKDLQSSKRKLVQQELTWFMVLRAGANLVHALQKELEGKRMVGFHL
jgi:hypothetical protein